MSYATNISRRDLFKAGGAAGATSLVAGCSALSGEAAKAAGEQTFHASCTMECLHCNLKATVRDGKIVKIESDNAFQGKACAKGLARTEWVYAKNRVLYPMKRVGRRGEGKFERISWDEALDSVAAKIREAIAAGGSQSIFMTHLAGNMDSLNKNAFWALWNHLGGITSTNGSLCCSAVTATMVPMLGFRTDTRDTISESRYILCWGNNPLITMQAYWHLYLKAKERGAKLVVIDPRMSETAARADQWVKIVPGTDAALSLGMLRVIHRENLFDEAFLKKHTGAPYLVDGNGRLMRETQDDANSYLVYDAASGRTVRHDAAGIDPALTTRGTALSGRCRTALDVAWAEAEKWTAEKVEDETGVPATVVEQLAREYAASGASMIIQNMGSFQRTEFGGYAAAGQFLLALVTGNIGRPGTGVCDNGGATQLAKFGAPIPGPKTKPGKHPWIPISKVGEWVLNDKPCKINFWLSMQTGLVGQFPNTNKVIKAIEHVPFFVVLENLFTATTQWADIVLPAAAVFEYKSITAGIRSHYVQWSDQAIEPQGEAKPDYWIAQQLARRLGFGEQFDLTPEQMAENVLKPSGIKLADVMKAPVCPIGDKPYVPYEGGKFRTPNGKANIYVEAWQQKGFSPVVAYYRPTESLKGNPALAKDYPLMSVQKKSMQGVHSSHHDNPWIKSIYGNVPGVEMNSEDARARHQRR